MPSLRAADDCRRNVTANAKRRNAACPSVSHRNPSDRNDVRRLILQAQCQSVSTTTVAPNVMTERYRTDVNSATAQTATKVTRPARP